MTRTIGLLAAASVGLATLATAVPAAAHHHFGRFGFGFGYPFYYPAYYLPPPVYPIYYEPAVYHYGYGYRYSYGYRWRRAHHHVRRVAHHATTTCSCNCCRG